MNSKVKLTFVGDVFPANLPYNRNCGVASLDYDETHRKAMALRIKDVLGDSDLLLGNLESPILSEFDFSRDLSFAGHPDFPLLLSDVGFDVVSLANNHLLEHGLDGVETTIQSLRRADIPFIGIDGRSFIWEKDGIRIGFIAYNAIDNNRYARGRVIEYDIRRVLDDIALFKKDNIDHIIVILHWGDEFIQRPSARQVLEAHSMIDSGASFVIGSHPHVIQPVEEYKNGLICYSLGNFLFDMMVPKTTRYGMILYVELAENGFSWETRYVKIARDFLPRRCSSRIESRIENVLKSQLIQMSHFDSDYYSKHYEKERKKRRIYKRITEKWLLVRNWRKYSPKVKKEIKEYYLHLLRNGKN